MAHSLTTPQFPACFGFCTFVLTRQGSEFPSISGGKINEPGGGSEVIHHQSIETMSDDLYGYLAVLGAIVFFGSIGEPPLPLDLRREDY